MVRMISQLPNTSGQVVQCRRMALIPFDQALVKADDNVFKTPFIPKKRKKVLEEEPYTKVRRKSQLTFGLLLVV